MIFTDLGYRDLYSLFSSSRQYAGYKPEVKEIPNGDGVIDAEKRYLHVALKYNPPAWALSYLARAHFEACKIAESIGIKPEYYPRVQDGTLRVLEYPVSAGTAEHTDFDLFTITCYRSTPEDIEQQTESGWTSGVPPYHIGEIGEMVGMGPATPHRVPPRDYAQHSIVYFAMPSLEAVLPNGQLVKEWLKERYTRSRVYK